MFKQIVKSTVISIGIALAIFCAVGIVFDIKGQGAFSMDGYSFTKMVLGCVAIGLGFGVPSVIYDNERIPRPVQVLIHMGIGCIVYTTASYLVGWMSFADTPVKFCLLLLGQIAAAFIIWFLFMAYYRGEARKMNEKLQAMK
ncbi:MAG: DUF3021 domain-containing protein [Clostridiales bacterium]|nr:DUF3021 domain-containing protein [Clostridiales bacterium]